MSSEGFSFDGTYFHCSRLLFSCIMCTLLATKVLNALVALPKYPNITLLSVQKYSSSSCSCNSFFIMFDIFFDSTVATSSSLGIDAKFLGATLAFHIIRLQCTCSQFHSQLSYNCIAHNLFQKRH